MDEIRVILLPKYLIILNNKAMNNTQHTSGPWSIIASSVVSKDRDKIVCDPFSGEIVMTGKSLPIDEREANARLIAAAPELLEALETLQSILARWNKDKAAEGRYTNVLDLIQTTIDKATK